MNLAKRSNLRWTVILVGLPFLFIWTSPSAGQDFDMPCNFMDPAPPGPPCDDATRSLGSFSIYVRWPYHGLMTGHPGYDLVTHILKSPTLFEYATVIGRSAPHVEGSPADINGTPVGSRGVMISDSDFGFVPPGFEVTEGREVHLEVFSLMMSDFGGGAAVRAGKIPFGLPLSPGEVESQSASGVPADDFPADGFFNMYVEVDIPPGGAFPGATAYNPGPGDPYPSRPMVVLAPNEWSFPPSVVYVHGQTNAVPVRFRFSSPGNWPANALFGWLIMAGHMTDPPMVCAPPGQCHDDAIEGCCGTCDPEFECCCPSVQAEAIMLAEMEADGEMPYPWCGNGVCELENEEQCDNGDDAACPGRCRSNCTCGPAPDIPTVSEWGLAVLTLLGLTIGTILLGRRRREGATG